MNASSRRSSRLRQGLLAVAAMVLSTGLVACGSSSSTSTASCANAANCKIPAASDALAAHTAKARP